MAKKKRNAPWSPKSGDFAQVFWEQNPWQETRTVPTILAREVERPLARYLWKRLKNNEPARYQVILGPRRVGKSTVMYQTVKRLLEAGVPPNRLWWLRLDHPLLMQVSMDKLVRQVISSTGATLNDPVYLFLDEVTYAAQWDLWLKTFYDDKWPVRVVGSSSATAAIRERRQESGVGRWEEQYLAPYLFGEYLELVGKPVELPIESNLSLTLSAALGAHIDLSGLAPLRRRFLLTGGFPELLLENNSLKTADEASVLLQSQRILRSDAVERAIYKDIPQAFGVADPLMLERLLYTLAGQVSGILSPQSLCQTLGGLSQPTFDRYLAYLERAFLVFTLANYSGSEASRQKRGRKLYFVDGAVRNAALQRGTAPLHDTTELGLLMENLIAGHLHALSQQSQIRVFHWHEKDQEVDLIYDRPQYPLAFEIGSSASHHRSGLHAFMNRFGRFNDNSYLVAPTAHAVPASESSDHIGTLPLDLLLLAISGQAEQELSRRLEA